MDRAASRKNNVKAASDYCREFSSGSNVEKLTNSPTSSTDASTNLPEKRMENMKEKAQNKRFIDIPVLTDRNLGEKVQISTDMLNIMVTNAVKCHEKPTGASFNDISRYLEETYHVNMKKFKACVHKALIEGVHNEVFDKISASYFLEKEGRKRKLFDEERFRIKGKANVEEEPQNFPLKDETETEAKKQRHDFKPTNVKPVTKETTYLPTREMLIMMFKNSIRSLNKRNGASFNEIRKYMEEKYQVDMKVLGPYAKNVFDKCVHSEMLEKVSCEASEEERFRINEPEDSGKSPENLLVKRGRKRKLFDEERLRIKEKENVEEEPQNSPLQDETEPEAKKPRYDSKPTNVKPVIKATTSPPTREMLIMNFKNSIRSPNKRNGASFNEISKYMEEKYQVDMETLGPYAKNIFDDCVDSEMLEKVSCETSEEETFRINEPEEIAKSPENLLVKGGIKNLRK